MHIGQLPPSRYTKLFLVQRSSSRKLRRRQVWPVHGVLEANFVQSPADEHTCIGADREVWQKSPGVRTRVAAPERSC